MNQFRKESGFNIIELIIVAGMMSIMLAIGGSLATRFFANRKVDNITGAISSTVQVAKLKSARHGVEYQAVISYDDSRRSLIIVLQMGDSNRGSRIYTTETFQKLNVLNGVTISPSEKTINFNPNGTLGGASGSITVKPTGEARIKRCGRIIVTPFGRIRVLRGNWDGTTCMPIN